MLSAEFGFCIDRYLLNFGLLFGIAHVTAEASVVLFERTFAMRRGF